MTFIGADAIRFANKKLDDEVKALFYRVIFEYYVGCSLSDLYLYRFSYTTGWNVLGEVMLILRLVGSFYT